MDLIKDKTSKEKKQIKAYWHIYHDSLLDFSANIEERIEYIKQHKSSSNIPLRLRLLKEVKGPLPEELVKLGKAWWKALEAYVEADDKMQSGQFDEEAYRHAVDTYDEVQQKLDYTICKYNKEHAKECPGCPWDGYSIFPLY